MVSYIEKYAAKLCEVFDWHYVAIVNSKCYHNLFGIKVIYLFYRGNSLPQVTTSYIGRSTGPCI